MKTESSEAASIASEKVIRTGLLGLTHVAPDAGLVTVTAGGSVSLGLDPSSPPQPARAPNVMLTPRVNASHAFIDFMPVSLQA
jgi:hypothetical protein